MTSLQKMLWAVKARIANGPDGASQTDLHGFLLLTVAEKS
jgi:hypothetical protein